MVAVLYVEKFWRPVTDYSFLVTYHGNVFVAFVSVEIHDPRFFQNDNIKTQIRRKGLNGIKENFALKETISL